MAVPRGPLEVVGTAADVREGLLDPLGVPVDHLIDLKEEGLQVLGGLPHRLAGAQVTGVGNRAKGGFL